MWTPACNLIQLYSHSLPRSPPRAPCSHFLQALHVVGIVPRRGWGALVTAIHHKVVAASSIHQHSSWCHHSSHWTGRRGDRQHLGIRCHGNGANFRVNLCYALVQMSEETSLRPRVRQRGDTGQRRRFRSRQVACHLPCTVCVAALVFISS